MGVFTQLVRSNGNEPTFIKKFIHTVLAADDRITCDKTDAQIDEMFGSGGRPEFTFDVGGMFTLYFIRWLGTGAEASHIYFVTAKSAANAGEIQSNLQFSEYREWAGVATNRQYWLRVVSSEKAILIMLGDYNEVISNTGAFSLRCIGYKDGNSVGFSAQKNDTGTSGMGSFFYIGDTRVTPVERLYFKNDPSDTRKAVVGKEKVMKDSSNYKQSVTNSLCDVSMIPSFLQKEIKAGDKHYFVITQTELMPL